MSGVGGGEGGRGCKERQAGLAAGRWRPLHSEQGLRRHTGLDSGPWPDALSR